jgi:hypothetical protein
VLVFVFDQAVQPVHTLPADPLSSTLLDGIGNVANTATNFREFSLQRGRQARRCATRAVLFFKNTRQGLG